MKFEVGQERVQVHFLAAYADAVFGPRKIKEILNYPSCPEIIIKVFQEKYTSFFSVKDLNDLFLFIENKIIKRPEEFYKKVKKKFDNDDKKTAKILFKKYADSWQEINAGLLAIKYITGYLPVLRYVEVVATRHLKDSFSNNNIKISNKELFLLTSVDSYITLTTKEKMDLLKIAIKYYRAKKEYYLPEIKKHAEKYKYIELHISTKNPLTYQDFERRLKGLFDESRKKLLSQLMKLKNQNLMINKHKKAIIKKYQFNKFERDILKILEFISEAKVKITDHICLLNFKLIDAAKKLSEQWGIQKKLFFLMFPEEIKKYSKKNKLDQKIISLIKKRKNAVIWVKGSRLKVFFGMEAIDFLSKKITEEKVKTNQISGTPIFKGKIKGIAKIVKSTKDFSKVKKGDILVSSDTTPDFVPVFSKVSAIITDEGGVICHAAIVAREMKIPCVVGTKIATKILKDNDLIEIDAEKGIIKKI